MYGTMHEAPMTRNTTNLLVFSFFEIGRDHFASTCLNQHVKEKCQTVFQAPLWQHFLQLVHLLSSHHLLFPQLSKPQPLLRCGGNPLLLRPEDIQALHQSTARWMRRLIQGRQGVQRHHPAAQLVAEPAGGGGQLPHQAQQLPTALRIQAVADQPHAAQLRVLMNDAQLGGGPETGGLVELLHWRSLAEEVVVGAVPQVAQPRHGLGHVGMVRYAQLKLTGVYARVLQMWRFAFLSSNHFRTLHVSVPGLSFLGLGQNPWNPLGLQLKIAATWNAHPSSSFHSYGPTGFDPYPF